VLYELPDVIRANWPKIKKSQCFVLDKGKKTPLFDDDDSDSDSD
jgi:hypothetical protein